VPTLLIPDLKDACRNHLLKHGQYLSQTSFWLYIVLSQQVIADSGDTTGRLRKMPDRATCFIQTMVDPCGQIQDNGLSLEIGAHLILAGYNRR
jgi:hypothetical protein